jgi:hypothetical protein
MVCNETLEAVDVAAHFVGTSLALDPANPPRPLEDTARPSTSSADLPSMDIMYRYLANVTTPENPLVDLFFAMLTSSRYAQPLGAIGDPAQTLRVADAIVWQHRILRAVDLKPCTACPPTRPTRRAGSRPCWP